MMYLPSYFVAVVMAIICIFSCIESSQNDSVSDFKQSALNKSLPATVVAAFDLPVQSFTISVDLLKSILSLDTESPSGLFRLSENPSNAVLLKLAHILRSNSKRVDAITYLIQKYTHYDSTSKIILHGVRKTKYFFNYFLHSF